MAKLLTIILTGVCVVISESLSAQTCTLQGATDSKFYISGDLVQIQLTISDGSQLLSNITTDMDLIDHEGNILLTRRFLLTRLDHSVAFYLPDDLPTGVYKAILYSSSCNSAISFTVNSYNPDIFGNSRPQIDLLNYDLTDTVGQETAGRISVTGIKATYHQRERIVFNATIDEETPVYWNVKVYDPRYETDMNQGIEITGGQSIHSSSFDFNLISSNPNSRITAYFLDQGMTLEGYVANISAFKREMLQHYGTGKVWLYQFDEQGKRLGPVKITYPPTPQHTYQAYSNQIIFNKQVLELLQKKRLRKLVEQSYDVNYDGIELLESDVNDGADYTIEPGEYNNIATVQEALSSIVPSSQVIKRKGKYDLRLSPSSSSFRYPNSPLVLINGVPSFEVDSIFEISSGEIKSISIYNSPETLKRFGTLGLYGVFALELKNGRTNPLDHVLQSIPEWTGINTMVPAAPSSFQGKPDVRATLLWAGTYSDQGNNPVRFSCFQNDVSGTYRIHIRAITASGRMYEKTLDYNIQPEF